MKVFTINEANDLLPGARLRISRLKKIHGYLREQRSAAQRAAANAVAGGGGMKDGGRYVARLLEFSEITSKFDELGIQIKDVERGLIDFPAWREGRIVLLCWQLGEGDQIEWWHDVDSGFAGRQPL